MSYDRVWGTPVGKDCISLDIALGKWLGERLVYLSYRENLGCPVGYAGGAETWRKDMLRHGQALVEYGAEASEDSNKAVNAMKWVAENFDKLWH